MLISNLTYIEGRTLKQPLKMDKFVPDYLGERKHTSDKTLTEQQAEFAAFHNKLKSMTGKQ